MKEYRSDWLPTLQGLPAIVLAQLCFVFMTLGVVLVSGNREYWLLIYGLACPIVVMLPFALMRRALCIYEPMAFIIGTLFISTVGRNLYVVLSDDPRTDFLLFEQPLQAVIDGGWVIPVALFVMSIAYCSVNSRIRLENIHFIRRKPVVYGGRLYMVSSLAIIASVAAGILVARNFDISYSDLDTLSVKRPGTIDTASGDTTYHSNGLLRFLASFSQCVMYLVLAYFYQVRKKLNMVQVFVVAMLFLANAIYPFLTSSRFAIISVVLNLFIIFATFHVIQVRKLLVAGALIVVVIYGMGELRHYGQNGNFSETKVVASVVGSGNFVDIPRTTAIIDRMDQYGLLHGETYLSLLTAPVPRRFWPEKPNPSLGPWVKGDLFGYPVRNNGWPPGFISEAYMNFGYYGVFAIAAVLGAALSLFFNSFAPLLKRSPVALVIYVVSVWPISVGIVGLNFAQGLMQALMSVVPMVLVAFVCTRPYISTASRRSPKLA